MKNVPLSLISVMVVTSLILSCKKDDDKIVPVLPAACILTGESTTLSGNQRSWTYEYDADGKMSRIDRFNVYGTKEAETNIGSNGIVNAAVTGPAVQENVFKIRYEGDVITGRPTRAFLSLQVGKDESLDYRTYFFFYDAKGRLNLVGEQTDYVNGDLEWDLHIGYNDQDNVTSLAYEITTGPAGTGSGIVVDAFDDKPSPFTNIPAWKFIMNNFAWDNYDPEPIISALSKNNPLDYTLNKGMPGEYIRTMRYEYNTHGFPTKRINTNKNVNGEYTFEQAYQYECQ